MAIIELFTANIITFTQSVNSNIKGCPAESRLTLTDAVTVNMASRAVDSRLWLSQTARVRKTLNLSVQNTLVFNQSCHPRSIHVEAFNGFIFWHELSIPIHHGLLNNLNLLQTALGVRAKAAKNTLLLTHSVNVQVIKVHQITNTLNMVSSATAWKVDKFWIAVPSLMYAAGPLVAFRYKDREFEFQAPLMGNSDSIEYLRISRESLGGDRQVFRDSNWPIIQLLNISFDVCHETEIAKIRELIKVSLGDFIEYRDHNGNWFDAFITNPDTAIKQTGRKAYTVGLQLEATAQ